MSGKGLRSLVVVAVLALAVVSAQGSPYDRVAYWDGTYGTAWAGDGSPVRDALQQAGYKVVNAAELKTWMEARITDRKLSVVVMCRDVVPNTVAETMTASCTIRRYLDAGGKMVWYSDWPFYYQGNPANVTWGQNGAIQILGFNAATGPNDQNQQVVITDVGRRWGLTTPWSSTRPTSPTVTPNLEVLATDNNGNAAGWVKHYVAGDTFRGFVRIDDHTGAPVNIPQLMAVAEYYVTVTTATGPVPGNGATNVPRDVVLGWTAGEYPSTHDVYFGTAQAEVSGAARTSPAGVLVGKGQTDTTFDPPGLLAYGQTYYWRIDEVNQSPDGTIHKGDVWSFTVEPYSYPITNVTATASSSDKDTTSPANTINRSGLTNDLHGTSSSTMWVSNMTGPQPTWIQYEFDRTYKLDELWVWNHNTDFEMVLGYGFKDVTVEYSTDGATWTRLKEAQFAQGTATGGYAHNTTLKLDGVPARYVRLTAQSNWSLIGIKQYGLSEVRFFHVPVAASAPQPAPGATGVPVDATLDWRPGREAGSHQVFFGTDQAAVAAGTAPVQTVTEHRYDPGSLNFGTTYYWKINEVNTVKAVTYPGDVWSFTTQEYAVVDDFESYTDNEGSRIYETWIDGWSNGTGSVVGYLQAPFAEQTIVHTGKQSMPFEYNNLKTPYYSEAERAFDTPLDWTSGGADTLALYFRGYPAGLVDKGNNAFTVSSTGSDIWNNSDQFRFVYKSLNGNGSITARVDSLTRSDAWSKAGVMIRENLDAGAKHASMVVTPDNSCSQQYRNATSGASNSTNWTGTAVRAPYWVRVTRTGNLFKTESSGDGKTWTALGTDQNITMAASVYIGLCLTSHNPAAYSTAEFSNVATAGTVTGAWRDASIGVTQRANDPAPLYLTVEDKAGKKKTVVHAQAAATATGAWTEWRIPLSDLTGVNLTAVKKITLGVGDRASPKPGPTGMLYLDDIGFGHPAK
ncbi:MAG: discoidin domain-containing protein [Planctomycetes bacterium]|nr:discoidin domain-containing protein [Planctomycetota bacterium]